MRILFLLWLLIGTVGAKSLFQNDQQAANSKYVTALKELIVSTQKMRGVTNGYLNGNVSALLLIYTYRDDMNKAIGTMESLPLSSDPIINKRSTEISQALIELNHKALKRKSEEVFESYTVLIDKMLQLAQSISKRGTKALSPFGQDASRIMMEELLPLAEQIGQLRGLGSGIIARGSIDEKEKVKIQAIMASAEKRSATLRVDMQQHLSKYKEHYPIHVHVGAGAIDLSVQKYIEKGKREVVKVKGSGNPDPYFDEGSNVIAKMMETFDASNAALLKDSEGWI